MKAPVLLLAALLVSPLLWGNELHPPVPLLDANGQPVMLSGQAMSSMETCGACHDAVFISETSDHRAAGVFGDGEIQCLVCHSDYEPAENPDASGFNDDGSLAAGMMNIRKPQDQNCAACHAVVDNELNEPLTVTPQPSGFTMTDRTGQVISPQKISNSGLNIANKNALTHPFDVHADRVVGCVDCHYSLNNPVYYRENSDEKPVHLEFDPRRLTVAEYLLRPMHQLAKGSSRDGLGAFESANSMRRCESCHDATSVHEWLPYKRRHFESLACEACHVPKLYGPALQVLDASLVDSAGNPRREYRAVEGDPASADSLIHGFRPVMLARENVGGERKLAPFNLVSRWHWLNGEGGERIGGDILAAALYRGDRLHSELLTLFDEDGDGEVTAAEFLLDSSDKVSAVAGRLRDAGIEQPVLSSDIHPYPVSHNVVNGRWATRDCRTCHGADSVLGASFTLSNMVPGGRLPGFIDEPGSGTSGAVMTVDGGGAVFVPDTAGEGYYIIGLDSVELVDLAGLGMFLAISLGVSGHGLARYFANRRRPKQELPTERVRLYDAYDRIWHWLQAGTILLLIFTGLIIHKPHFFGMFSFAYVVEVHNVLGFILLINAALALFYTLASGTIRRFFPNPDGFFMRVFEQAMFYSRGIFAGEGHPMQKTPQNRLNPLQQVTYLAIINILLPAQVITGVLIWGTQEWPQLAGALGGLPVLAPVHTFVAWAFAAFIVMHVYLTTTGETPLSGIKSMVTGWEDIEQHAHDTSEHSKETSHV